MSSFPPPPDAPDVLLVVEYNSPGSAMAAAIQYIADAARLPEWVLLAEVARRRGAIAPDDAAIAERLWRAHEGQDPGCRFPVAEGSVVRAAWLRVAAEARAAFGFGPGVTDVDRYVEAFREVSARVPVGESDAAAEPVTNADRAALALPWCECAEPQDIMYGGNRGVCATCGRNIHNALGRFGASR